MSVVAGYVAKSNEHDPTSFIDTFTTYPILAGDRPADYHAQCLTIAGGVLAVKHKPGFPLPPGLHQDDRDGALLSLGYWRHDDAATAGSPGDVLRRCGEHGAGALEELAGEFIAALWESNTGRLHLVNDRFGSRPCYWTETDDRFVFASNLPLLCRLTGIRRQPDLLGWLQMCSYSHTLGRRTNVRGIQRLLPASHLTLHPDGVHEKQYWRLVHEPLADPDPTLHAERVFAAHRSSTERCSRLARSGIIALSGGLDSRLVAAGLPPDAGFSAYTFVDSIRDETTPEVQAASEVSRLLGLTHHIDTLPPTTISSIAPDVIGLSGGLLPLHFPVGTMRYIEFMRRGRRFKLGSGVGDVLAGSYINSPLACEPALGDRSVRGFRRARNCAPTAGILRSVFRADVLDEYFPQVETSAEETFASIAGPTAAHRITAWAMVYRQPAFTLTSPLYTHPDVTEAVPFLDYAYADLMLQLPASWLYRRNFYSFMIHHGVPALRPVIYANTGRPLQGALQEFGGSYLRDRLKLMAGDLFPARGYHALRLARRRLRPRSSAPPFRLTLMLDDAPLMADIESTIDTLPHLRAIIDAERCRAFLRELRRGIGPAARPVDDANLLGTLATLCLTTRMLD